MLAGPSAETVVAELAPGTRSGALAGGGAVWVVAASCDDVLPERLCAGEEEVVAADVGAPASADPGVLSDASWEVEWGGGETSVVAALGVEEGGTAEVESCVEGEAGVERGAGSERGAGPGRSAGPERGVEVKAVVAVEVGSLSAPEPGVGVEADPGANVEERPPAEADPASSVDWEAVVWVVVVPEDASRAAAAVVSGTEPGSTTVALTSEPPEDAPFVPAKAASAV